MATTIRIVQTSVSTLVILAMFERARAALDLVEPAIGREFVDDAIRRLETAIAAQDDGLDDDAGRPEPRGTSRDLGAH
jgi:hypothetical protein